MMRLFTPCYKSGWGIVNMFQTFEDLESVKDKQAEIQIIRQLLEEGDERRANY
jgi:hypothetical protein